MMNKMTTIVGVSVLMALTTGMASAAAQDSAHHRRSPEALLKAERAAMQSFQHMAGVWRGKASMTLRSGEKHTIIQTERVGPFLDGAVMVMEGRGYATDGSVSFNALGIISYAPRSKTYTMRAYAQGHAGNFTLKPTDDGFAWDIKAGPMSMHYVATVNDGTWHEVGTRTLPSGKSVKFFEMTLQRVGDTGWPAAGAVPFKP